LSREDFMDSHTETILRVLDSQDVTTGGGTAAAVAGAMAASLAAMVARLSIGKKDMRPEAFYTDLASQLEALSKDLLQGAQDDSQAFGSVTSALRLPKESPEKRTTRTKAIQAAWVQAAKAPLTNAERCFRVLQLSAILKSRSNPNAASDLSCAGHLARAGLAGCLDNVELNIPSIKDDTIAKDLSMRVDELRKRMQSSG
jgi:formiminotetrahydrofolate cyclodeaminase